MTSAMGLKGGCITAVINVRGVEGESVKHESLEMGERNVIKSVVRALKLLTKG